MSIVYAYDSLTAVEDAAFFAFAVVGVGVGELSIVLFSFELLTADCETLLR